MNYEALHSVSSDKTSKNTLFVVYLTVSTRGFMSPEKKINKTEFDSLLIIQNRTECRY